MAVSRFQTDNADNAVDRSFLLSDIEETLAVMPAPEDLLSDAERDRIAAFEPLQARLSLPVGVTLIGTPGNDVLRGTPFTDRISGLAGNDRLFGEGSGDVLSGGLGNDRVVGGRGSDELFGDEGRDLLLGGRAGDRMRGGGDDDELRGGPGEDIMFGESGRDELFGGDAGDQLFGQGARDLLIGGNGNDVLVGGLQPDRLSGGSGQDRFVYNSFDDAGDTIIDFDRRRDVLDLRRLLRGDNFSNPDPFKEYVIIVREDEDVTIIRVDADGDRGDRPFRTLATLENINFEDVRRSNFLL